MSIYGKEPGCLEAETGYYDMMFFEEIRMAIQNEMVDICFWKRLNELLEKSDV